MKHFKIRLAEEADQESWDAFVHQERGGPYLYWAWKQAVEEAYGHRGYYLVAELGGKILGLFPLFLFQHPWGKPALVSLPFCDYGGILASEEGIARALWEEALALAQRLGASSWDIRFKERPSFLPEGRGETAKVRLILKLPPSADELWKALKSKVRSQVRRPMKEGAEAVVGGLELLPAFYRIYQENMHFLGSPPHALAWFKQVVGRYGDRARVVVVSKDGEPLAAGLILLSADTVTVPWASSRRAYKRISPNMLLYWQFLSFAAENGFKYFDFGRSTPGSGTFRFKKQWGAVPVPLFWYQEPARASGGSRLRPLVEKVWRRLPAPVVNGLGPRLRRYIAL